MKYEAVHITSTTARLSIVLTADFFRGIENQLLGLTASRYSKTVAENNEFEIQKFTFL